MAIELGELSLVTWIAILVLALVACGLLVLAKGRKRWTPVMLAQGALTIALSFLLSYVKLFPMPMGGSVTLCSMLPILLFAYHYGLPSGLLTGVACGLLQILQKSPPVPELLSMALDYPIAFGLLSLAALARKLPMKKGQLYAGIALGCLGRFAASYLSGVVFYGIYAPYNPLLYSFVYNISYVGAEMVVCMAVVSIPAVRGLTERLYKLK